MCLKLRQVPEPERLEAEANTFPKWKEHTAAVRNKMKFGRFWAPWTSREEVRLHGVPQTPRVKDLLNVAFGCRLEECEAGTGWHALLGDFVVDLSQAVERKPWGEAGTFTTGVPSLAVKQSQIAVVVFNNA